MTPLPETKPTAPAPARKPSGNGIQAEPADDGGLAMPFLRNEDGKEGWDVITDEAAQAEEGASLVVDMNGATVVPADVFEEIQGRACLLWCANPFTIYVPSCVIPFCG